MLAAFPLTRPCPTTTTPPWSTLRRMLPPVPTIRPGPQFTTLPNTLRTQPLLYSTPPHFHHPSWEDTLAPPPVTPIIHQPSSPHPVEHHHFYHPQPVATPLLHTPQPQPLSSTIPVVHPLLTSKPWTPPEVWDPVPAAAILPSSSTAALAEVHYHIPAKWRRVLRARKLLTGWPLNFLHLSRRRGPWAKHARRLGRIVSRIRWLEKYIWRSHTTVKHYH